MSVSNGWVSTWCVEVVKNSLHKIDKEQDRHNIDMRKKSKTKQNNLKLM